MTSDWHLDAKAPAARSKETHWWQCQGKVLGQLKNIQSHYNGCPIIVAGDLFDRPHQNLHFLNWIIEELPPNTWAIPGQHDLRHHNLSNWKQTAFGTLIVTKTIKTFPISAVPINISEDLAICAFPWGVELAAKPPHIETGKKVCMCVAHKFVWTETKGHAKAKDNQHIKHLKTILKTYDAAIFGDNHKGFMIGKRVMNCGTLMRRHSNEIDYRPQIGVLYSNGKIIPYQLNTSNDIMQKVKRTKQKTISMKRFSKALIKLQEKGVKFEKVLLYYTNKKADNRTRKLIKEIIHELES